MILIVVKSTFHFCWFTQQLRTWYFHPRRQDRIHAQVPNFNKENGFFKFHGSTHRKPIWAKIKWCKKLPRTSPIFFFSFNKVGGKVSNHQLILAWYLNNDRYYRRYKKLENLNERSQKRCITHQIKCVQQVIDEKFNFCLKNLVFARFIRVV